MWGGRAAPRQSGRRCVQAAGTSRVCATHSRRGRPDPVALISADAIPVRAVCNSLIRSRDPITMRASESPLPGAHALSVAFVLCICASALLGVSADCVSGICSNCVTSSTLPAGTSHQAHYLHSPCNARGVGNRAMTMSSHSCFDLTLFCGSWRETSLAGVQHG